MPLMYLKAFGKVSYDAPSSINIYVDSFEDKEQLTKCIDNYNQTADPEDTITYTDYTAMLTSPVTTIINGISYVLIAFVAISLVVSCIMIGIITHISVMERTKEIGIKESSEKRSCYRVENGIINKPYHLKWSSPEIFESSILLPYSVAIFFIISNSYKTQPHF